MNELDQNEYLSAPLPVSAAYRCGVTAPHIQAVAKALGAPLPTHVIPADLP